MEPGAKEGASQVQKEDARFDLGDDERKIIEEQLELPAVNVTYRSLYRYAEARDILIMSVGSVCAIAAGAVLPLMTIVFGHFAGMFTNFLKGDIAASAFTHELHRFTLYFVYLGLGSFSTTMISMTGFSYTGERMTQKIREAYLSAVLRQNIAFFDKVGAGEVTSHITADVNSIQDGISQKVSLTLTGVATFFAALVVGFARSWKLTLVLLSVTLSIVLVMGGIGKPMKKFQMQSSDSSAVAGTLAEEAISSIRTATAFGTQDRLAQRYDEHLVEASKLDFKGKAALALLIASMMCILNLQYGLAFWQGSRFLKDGVVQVSQILTVLFASVLAGVSLGHIAPHVGAFGLAIAAARKIFQTIDRKSPLDPESEAGKRPKLIEGEVAFRNVSHIYPSRPETLVLEDFSLTIPPGKVTAIVGASGCGKSTVIGLIERFYLPVGGELSIDGHNLDDLNLRWLRSQISLVGQEPILFSTTIYSNIEYGLVGTEHENADQATKHKLVENASKIANALDFVSRLPEGFQTRVGERGSRLSGGQKQRIAIARAIVSNPKILLLDEATAALDTESEKAVQVALEAASKGRTTVVIAHRLSTIKDADNIVVMAEGKIIEQGSHDQLLDHQGAYFTLVESQRIQFEAGGHQELSNNGDQVSSTEEEKVPRLTLAPSNPDARITDGDSEKNAPASHTTWQLVKFIWSMNEKEKKVMIFGFLSSLITGSGYPVTAILFGNAIISLSFPGGSNGGHNINFWAAMFLMLGIVMLIFFLLQGVAFAFASSRLIQRARALAFRSILRQEIAFFDRDENASGTLASFLSTETNHVAGISGATLGAILNFLVTIVGAIAVSCSFGWKLALVCTSTMPVLLACGFLRFWVLTRLERYTKRATNAAAFACEATSAIRTVASLTLERDILQRYHQSLDAQAAEDMQQITLSSLLYALSQSLQFFAMGLAFWYGGTLIVNHEYTVQNFFICFVAIIWGSQSAAGIFTYAPDMGHAREAANQLKSLLDTTPYIDSWSKEGTKVQQLDGAIEFRNVYFAYPARPEQSVVNGVTLTAKPGQLVALVGESGSGKSTTIALLERFYDPIAGGVFVDGQDISTYHLQDYRSHLALVSQETTLHMGTIRENILADKVDETEEAIVKACKDANIYDFIMSLPDGFNTLVGTKGSLLSGGQKQRLAIAKALLRDPKILLLDEATSALDSESEKAVQIALDRAAKGRTTIAIAHRLSTIQHADMVYVFEAGRVVECGAPEELMGRRGRYWELVRLQELGGAERV